MLTPTLATYPPVSHDGEVSEFLCSDLDGTILNGDSLWESLLALIGAQPWYLFAVPFWLSRGKAALKHEIAKRVSLNIATLPFCQEVIEFLRQQKSSGRILVLATGADQKIAAAVAEHLGLFDVVLASDGRTNLTGDKKRDAIERLVKGRKFDYIGNGKVDLAIWKFAAAAILVAPNARLLKTAQSSVSIEGVFGKPRSYWSSVLRALRPQHWIKNLLILLPLGMAHEIRDLSRWTHATLAIISFCLCASGVYILNDLFDLEADRIHPTKMHRPFASGKVPVWVGLCLAPLLLVSSLLVGFYVSSGMFFVALITYIFATTAYSTYLKRIPIVDVLVLTGLYLLRILAGGVATQTPVSPWLLSFSMFLLLSLAFTKRHAELVRKGMAGGPDQLASKRNYTNSDAAIVMQFGVSSGFVSVLVLALYLNSRDVLALYHHPQMIWLVCPLLLFWISRLWFIASRGELSEDPVVFAAHDSISHIVGLLLLLVLVIAT